MWISCCAIWELELGIGDLGSWDYVWKEKLKGRKKIRERMGKGKEKGEREKGKNRKGKGKGKERRKVEKGKGMGKGKIKEMWNRDRGRNKNSEKNCDSDRIGLYCDWIFGFGGVESRELRSGDE